MKMSIRTKFSIFLAMLLLLTVSMLSILMLHGIEKNQRKEQESYLAQQAKTANIYIRELYHSKDYKELKEFLQSNGENIAKQLDSMISMNIAVYDISGKEIGNSLLFSSERDTEDILSYALKDNIAYQVIGDTMDYMSPLYDSEGQIGVIRFQYSLKKYIDFYNEIRRLFIIIGVTVFILSFLGAYLYFHKFVKVILMLKSDVDKIRTGNYDFIVPIERNDEIGELSKGIYYMNNQIKKSIYEMEEEQKKLRLAVEKLKKLEKQQKTFIGNITHEFKTPLTVIKAYIDLLNMYEDDPKLIKDAKTNIGKETSRLYELVDKVLYLSSLEKYDFQLQQEKIDIKDVIEDISERMKGKAQKFNIHLEEKLIEAVILGDKESLIHIFVNLIDNGIKYNIPEGKVIITNYIEKERVYIEVSDTGKGIPKEDREKVFDSFYTVDKNRSKEHGGTGLGLAIVKELVEKQRGTIFIKDTKQEGTTVSVSFPLS
ncbi:sensor histidine kinase [Oceanirhabdus sp. W0125-5]|uniref:sensor histidine kinase n=1 Tax=Oceanirhabdus sp. W0125-5 TaxID=2999116 RepID=UPI0022F2B16E|nr:HAMP domain-containing sensor histidine kinase [Oceanirhabdus sp. W0125-5]WBW97184.1 HAMP domain-containing sensor histidine kinase [Oceanirhabdus sp. W0125-5]